MIIRILCFVCPIFEGIRMGASIFDFFLFYFHWKAENDVCPIFGWPCLSREGRRAQNLTHPPTFGR